MGSIFVEILTSLQGSKLNAKQTLGVIVIAVVLVLLLFSLFGGGMTGWEMMDGPGHKWGWDGGGWTHW